MEHSDHHPSQPPVPEDIPTITAETGASPAEVTEEYVTLRSLEDVLRFRKPQELPETWRQVQNPEERLDRFMEETAPIFEDSARAWQQVRASQQAWDDLKKGTGARLNRDKRRGNQKKYGAALGNGRNVWLGLAKQQGHDLYITIADAYFNEDTPYGQRQAALEASGNDLRKETEKTIIKTETSDEDKAIMRKAVADQLTYLQAFAAQDEAIKRIASLLKDASMAAPFVTMLQSMASDNERARSEYPGFLEIVATHTLQNSTNSFVRKAVYAAAPKAEAYSGAYLRLLIDGERVVGRSKELAIIAHMLRLTGTIVHEGLGTSPDYIPQRMAEDITSWPSDLRTDLEAYATTQRNERWEMMASALQPYERTGRVVTKKSGVKIIETEKKRGKHGADTERIELRFGERDQNNEDIVEPEAISSFAIVDRNVKKNVYDVEFVDTVEELYELSNLAAYAEAHREDTSLKPLFKAVLQHLLEKPYDNSCTEKLQNVEYQVVGDAREEPRKPRRFKPQTFRGVPRGPIARDTRIIYDVVKFDGKQTLVIYGAFIKQAIEGMNALPSRS